MADKIIAGLRSQRPQSNEVRPEAPRDTGDEAVGPGVSLGKKKRKGRGSRSPWENQLSVRTVPTCSSPVFIPIFVQEKIRSRMEHLIPDADWMEDTVTKDEANDFNPLTGPCCDVNNFRLHLEGTTCDLWNRSAMEVFVEDFLAHHPEYSKEVDSVRDMVMFKTRATITSMIKEYRKLKLSPNELDELQLRKNRTERKRGVSRLYYPRWS
jgi:hypothetical protein